MPLLEVGHRQPDQMPEQAGAQLKVQNVLHNQEDEGADGRRGGLDQHQQTKAESEDDQQIDVTARDHLVDRELQVQGSGENSSFQDDRQHQDLDERVSAPAQLAQKAESGSRARSSWTTKAFRRRKLERDSGQMFRGLGDRERISRPLQGHARRCPRRVTDFRTTKWFMSQCRMAGSCSWREVLNSKRSGRQRRWRWLATWIRARSVTPLSEAG